MKGASLIWALSCVVLATATSFGESGLYAVTVGAIGGSGLGR